MNVRLGIDLGGSFIKAGIIDSSNKIVARLETPSGAGSGADAVIKNLQSVLSNLKSICKKKSCRISSLGIGSPGTISQPEGIVTDASPNIKNWRGTVLTKIFDNIRIPVYADNDANCVALAEYVVGFKYRYENMIFVTIGTGIGGGIILDNRLFRGSNYAASEFGHIKIRHNGKLCKCGMKGCLEAYASVPNMLRRFYYWNKKSGYRIKSIVTPVELFTLYKNQNKAAIKTVEENADYLGVGLGSIVNILNPEAVVIGGGFSNTGKEYINLIKASITRNAFKSAVSRLKVVKARLGNNAGFVGAALLHLVEENGKINKK